MKMSEKKAVNKNADSKFGDYVRKTIRPLLQNDAAIGTQKSQSSRGKAESPITLLKSIKMAGKEPWQLPEVGKITNEMKKEAKQLNMPMEGSAQGYPKLVQLPASTMISKVAAWDKKAVEDTMGEKRKETRNFEDEVEPEYHNEVNRLNNVVVELPRNARFTKVNRTKQPHLMFSTNSIKG
jgi:hypothetical protein